MNDGASGLPVAAAAAPPGPFICATCGARYAALGDCPACPGSALLDLRRSDVQELLADIDDRVRRTREQRHLWVGVAIAILVVGFLNLHSFWQAVRRATIVLPFFSDQIILMSCVAFGVQRLLVKLFPAPRVTPP